MTFQSLPAHNKIIRWAAPVGAVLLIWALITVKGFSFVFFTNEVDVLPSVKQFVEPDWLPNDWYLNLDIGYRQPFNLIFGTLVSQLDFQYGSYVGRLLVYLLLAVALYIFFRAFQLQFWLGLAVLLIYFVRQSIIAGEWVVGGVETKSVAYAFTLISCALFYRKRSLLAFAFAGAAISFHILIGLYGLFCTAVSILLNSSWRAEWRQIIRQSWPLFVTGIFGFLAIINQLLPQDGVDTARAWEIYVRYRVPHHMFPTAWVGHFWVVNLVLSTALFLALYLVGKSRAIRFVAAYALGSVSLFLIGLTLYSREDIYNLRYYWYRFPDVMIPLLAPFLVALLLNNFLTGKLSVSRFSQTTQARLRLTVNRGGAIVLTIVTLLTIWQTGQQIQNKLNYLEKGNLPAFEWIAKNTPQQAVFLVDPTMDNFYIHAQRAMFVSFKHAPQSAAGILEWHERITWANGNQKPKRRGLASKEELHTNFYTLTEEQIREIADFYGIGYYLGLTEQPLPFKRVYSDSRYTLYKIEK